MNIQNFLVSLMNTIDFPTAQIGDNEFDVATGDSLDGRPEYVTIKVTRKATKDIKRKDGKVIAAYDHDAAVAAYEATLAKRATAQSTSKSAQAREAKKVADKIMQEACIRVLSATPRTADEVAVEIGEDFPGVSRQKVARLIAEAVNAGLVVKTEKDKHVAYILPAQE